MKASQLVKLKLDIYLNSCLIFRLEMFLIRLVRYKRKPFSRTKALDFFRNMIIRKDKEFK